MYLYTWSLNKYKSNKSFLNQALPLLNSQCCGVFCLSSILWPTQKDLTLSLVYCIWQRTGARVLEQWSRVLGPWFWPATCWLQIAKANKGTLSGKCGKWCICCTFVIYGDDDDDANADDAEKREGSLWAATKSHAFGLFAGHAIFSLHV